MTETTHIIRVALEDDSSVYRDIELPSKAGLDRLAEAIVTAFDFDMDHAYGFYSGITPQTMLRKQPKYELFADMGYDGTNAGSVRKTPISKAYPKTGATLLFLFDYGDEWVFRTRVLGIGERVPRRRYPRVVASQGEAPQQYFDIDDVADDAADD